MWGDHRGRRIALFSAAWRGIGRICRAAVQSRSAQRPLRNARTADAAVMRPQMPSDEADITLIFRAYVMSVTLRLLQRVNTVRWGSPWVIGGRPACAPSRIVARAVDV